MLFLLSIFAVVYLHLSMFFILLLYLHLISRLPLPCHRHSLLASQAREGLHQLLALPQLLFSVFSFSSTASATVLRGHFLPTGVFYLTLLPDIFGTFPTFWHNLLLSRFYWDPAVTFLKVPGLICLFDSQ